MDKTRLERIRQKAEEYETRRDETIRLQEQEKQARLERIRQKAEEYEREKQQHEAWNDHIQAMQETYGLSEAEMKTIILEVEQEEGEKTLPQSEVLETDTYQQLKKLFFSPKGRIKRGTFGMSIIATVMFQAIISSIASKGLAPLGVFALVAIYSQIVLFIKRFHDLDKSGGYAFLSLIPVINFIVFLYLLLFPGTDEPNRFDEDP